MPHSKLPGVETADYAGANDWGAKFYFDMGSHILRMTDANGNELFELVERRYYSEFVGSYGLPWYGIELGVALPVIFQESIDRPVAGIPAPNDRGIGDVRFFVRGRILGAKDSRFSLGASFAATLPTSKVTFAGADDPTYHPRLVFDWKERWMQMAVNGGFLYRSSAQFANVDVGHAITFGAGVRVPIPGVKILSAMGEGEGQVIDYELDERHIPAMFRFGGLVQAMDGLEVSAGYGRSITDGLGNSDGGGFMTVSYRGAMPKAAANYRPAPGAGVVGNQIVPENEVTFVPESDELEESSGPALDAVAKTLEMNPGMRFVNAEVYAPAGESGGTVLYLASRRAKKLQEALMKRGVPAERVSANGYLEYPKGGTGTDRKVKFRFSPNEFDKTGTKGGQS